MSISLGIMLVLMTILTIAHLFGSSIQTIHKAFTVTKFWILLVIILKALKDSVGRGNTKGIKIIFVMGWNINTGQRGVILS